MTVTSVKPFENTDGGVDAESVRTYTNVYHVETNDKDDGSLTARGSQAIALGLPAYGDSWSWYNDSDPYAFAKTRRASLIDVSETRKRWAVTIGYTTKLQSRNPADDPGQPELEPWKISGSYAVGTKAVDRDRNGNAVTNSAEQPIISDIPDGRDTLILEGNTATIDLGIRAAAMLKCNSTPMWGLGVRRFLLMQWSYDIAYQNLTPYVRHRLEFHIADDDKWNLITIDKGTRTLEDDTQTDPRLRYKPVTARDTETEVYLDGAGQPYDIAAFPLGYPLNFELIDEYDFLSNLTFLPNPLPGPFA